MKKVILCLVLASLMCVYGCEETESVPQNEISTETTSATEVVTDEVITEPTTERPTERVVNSVDTENFRYEIYEGAVTILRYTGQDAIVEIPSEIEGVAVTTVGFYAFEACDWVTDVTIPDTVTLIGEGAFMDCPSLVSINIPETVTGIDRGAFVGCTSLTEITVPEKVAYIREEAFTACESLTSLTLNNGSLKYENWGLEALPNVTVYAESGSEVEKWATEMGKFSTVS